MAAFLITHEDHRETVEFGQLANTLLCYCGVCNETLTYRITG